MLKILIVENEETSRMMVEKVFKQYGECTSVETGEEALSTYKEAFDNKEPFELIVLDYALGDSSGLDILKKMRAHEKKNGIARKEGAKIVMVTSHNKVNIVKNCIAGGCNNFILKPIEPEIVEEKLSKLGIAPVEKE